MTLILLQSARRNGLHAQFFHRLRIVKPSSITKRPSSSSPPRSSSAKAASDSATHSGTSIPVPNTVANLPLWQRLGPLSRFFEAFGRSQRKRPLATQFASSICIYFLGDLSAQSISGEAYDPKRTLRALMIGAGSSIPSYKWFLFLGNHFNYASRTLSLLTKVVVNQIVFTPIFNTYFFGMQSLLSNIKSPSLPQTWDHITRTVPTSMINSCKLWPAVTAFNFTFVSPQYRSIFAGFIAIGWQTYLSYLNRQAEGMERRDHAEQMRLLDTSAGAAAKGVRVEEKSAPNKSQDTKA